MPKEGYALSTPVCLGWKLVTPKLRVLVEDLLPIDWRKTIFNMMPKHGRANVPAEYRPIASIRLLYKTFAYMILGRTHPAPVQPQTTGVVSKG